MNNRAQVGSTLSWFFAVIAIFLILLVFLVFSGSIAAQKISIGKIVGDKIVVLTSSEKEGYSSSYISSRGAIVLLESPYNDKTKREYFVSSMNLPNDILDEAIDCYNFCFELPGFLAAMCSPANIEYSLESQVNPKLIDIKLAEEGKGYNSIKFGAYYGCEK